MALRRSPPALPRLFDSVRRFAAPQQVLPWRREARCGYGTGRRPGVWKAKLCRKVLIVMVKYGLNGKMIERIL